MWQGLRQFSRRPGRAIVLSLAVLTASAVAGICSSVAAAGNPSVHFSFGPFTFTETIPGASGALCPFDVTLTSTYGGTGTDFFDRSGTFYREQDNFSAQDTFSANGKSLTGMPYAYNITFLVDSSGNLTGETAHGVTEKVPLPNGKLFIGAGTIDFAANGFPNFLFIPDNGGIQNLAGLCTALAP